MDTALSTIGLLIFVLALAVGAWMIWGGDDPPPPDPFEGGLELVYRPHLGAAREAGVVTADESDEMLLAQTMAAVERRVRALGIAEVAIRHVAPEHIVVTLSKDAHERLDDVMHAISPVELPVGERDEGVALSLTDLELRLVVEPWEQARAAARDANVRADDPPRLWPEDRAAYERFLAEEVLVWLKARSDAIAYLPSREGFKVVRKEGRSGDELWDFIVVRTSASSLENLFGGPMLGNVVARRVPATGRAELLLTIAVPFRTAFGRFTQRHRGLKLAMILNGESSGAPVIMARLDRSIAVSLPSLREAEALAARLLSGALSGPLRVRLGFVEQREVTE